VLAHQELAFNVTASTHPVCWSAEDVLVVGDRNVIDENVDPPEARDHGLNQSGHFAAA
jgi:hypothetical protein